MSLFSERLTEVRKNMNWTRKRAVSEFRIPYQTYSNYESGKREPDLDTITKFATAFNTSTDYLIGLTDNPNPINNPTDTDENQLLISYRKHTAEMSPDEKRKFQRSLDHLMEAAKELNKED